jgi:hypothetical protein
MVPRWRVACRVRGHKLVSHAEQVPQDIGCDAGQTNQHGGVVEIVVGHVVDIRVCCESSARSLKPRRTMREPGSAER